MFGSDTPKSKWTPLMRASAIEAPGVVTVLLDRQADVNHAAGDVDHNSTAFVSPPVGLVHADGVARCCRSFGHGGGETFIRAQSSSRVARVTLYRPFG